MGNTSLQVLNSTEHENVHSLFKISIRQYQQKGVLYREHKSRKVTWDELFLDLIYVAAFNKIGHVFYRPTWSTLSSYLLVLWPVWNSWLLTHYHSNRYGVSSVHKFFIWIVMILVACMGITATFTFKSDPAKDTGNIFISCFLIFRFFYLIYGLIGIYNQPRFLTSNMVLITSSILSSVPFFISIFLDSSLRTLLWWIGILLDYIFFFIAVAIGRNFFQSQPKVALNIEHHTERHGLLTLIGILLLTLVIGEVVVGFLWDSSTSYLTLPFLSSIFGMIIAISFFWIYFNIDGSNQQVHAIRRSALSAVSWNVFHFPLHATIIAVGANMKEVVLFLSNNLDDDTFNLKYARYVLCIGSGFIILLFTIISLMHKSNDNKCNVSTPIRIAFLR